MAVYANEVEAEEKQELLEIKKQLQHTRDLTSKSLYELLSLRPN